MSPLPGLVATDLDGTLLDDRGRVSDRTRAAVAALEEHGVPFVVVTARPMRWMHDLRHIIGPHGLAIVSNGAILYDVAADAPVELTGIEAADGLALVERVRAALPGAQFAVETAAGIVLEPEYDEPYHVPDGSPVGPLAQVWTAPGVKILVRAPDVEPAVLQSTVVAAVGEAATPTWSGDALVEIGPAGVTKATALARLAASLGVEAEGVVAFGDMPNDLPMLRWAGHACAVANAHPDVLAAADEVVPAHTDDGVARTLERLLG